MEITDENIHGQYVGLSLGAAVNGASYDHARIEMTIDAQGITLPFLETKPDDPRFSICYPTSWIFHMQGWGVEKGLSIRQHARSDLAQMIVCPADKTELGHPLELVVLLGEGMPAPLMIFIHSSCDEQELRATYELLMGSNSNDFYDNRLTKFASFVPTIDEPMQIVSHGTVEEKLRLVENLAKNLWLAPSEVIAERVAVCKQLLEDPDPKVQMRVMEAVTLGARVTDMVPLVVSQLQKMRSVDMNPSEWSDLVGMTCKAAVCLLHEVHAFLLPRIKVKQRFGSLNVADIHKRCAGRIDPIDQQLMTDFFHGLDRRSSREWERRHYYELRTALAELAKRPGFSMNRDTVWGLESYSLPPIALAFLQEP